MQMKQIKKWKINQFKIKIMIILTLNNYYNKIMLIHIQMIINKC
jgi:hypothetical protein